MREGQDVVLTDTMLGIQVFHQFLAQETPALVLGTDQDDHAIEPRSAIRAITLE